MKSIQAVFFDIDNTLIDTKELIFQSFEHTLKKHNLPSLTRDELSHKIGPGALVTYGMIAPDLDAHTLADTHIEFQKKNLALGVVFPHAESVLKKLKEKKIKIGGVTTRSKKTVYASLHQSNIDTYFDVIYCLEDVTRAKPHPEAILKGLEVFQVKPEHAVMVGDSLVDVQAGKAAGVRTVGITTGFHADQIKDAQPDFVIHDIQQLLSTLLSD